MADSRKSSELLLGFILSFQQADPHTAFVRLAVYVRELEDAFEKATRELAEWKASYEISTQWLKAVDEELGADMDRESSLIPWAVPACDAIRKLRRERDEARQRLEAAK